VIAAGARWGAFFSGRVTAPKRDGRRVRPVLANEKTGRRFFTNCKNNNTEGKQPTLGYRSITVEVDYYWMERSSPHR
jgi:hypothetical protein